MRAPRFLMLITRLLRPFSILLYLFLISLFVSSCGKEPIIVTIDNPTYRVFDLRFENGHLVSMERYAQHALSFSEAGSSKLYFNDTLIGEIRIEDGKEYLLNPTKSTYLIEELGYGAAGVHGKRKLESHVPVGMDKEEWEKQKKPELLSLNTITVDSLQYVGYVNKTEDL